MKIVYTFKARQDLRDIYEYIAYTLLVPVAASKMVDAIMKQVRTLDTIPKRNPLYKDEPWHSRGVRFLPIKNYLIFYTVDVSKKTVFVIRIMYGGRDIWNQLNETAE